ncbi:S41 family peptidase [Mucilaginibacter sp. PAMB04274]|uniref:S41 family peptidase n=1 Tax=Mucilaginibacter sp. PAMB04274 TaxID=3138568 RepID=UPI0031F63407
MKKYLLPLLFLAVAFSSCKKDKKDDDLREIAYDFAKDVYLWNDALPSKEAFNPTRFSGGSDLANLQAEIDAFSQIKINSTTGKPYEYDKDYPGTAKYSYIDKGQAAAAVGGVGGDFGFGLSLISQSPVDIRVRYVYPNSSAATQGLARGYKVTAVNDVVVTASGIAAINQALGANSIKLSGTRNDGTTFTATVTRGSYTVNPVIKATTITSATGKKVGYFAFSRFTVISNAQAKIDEAFSKFASDNIEELVVDLRYNGGGAVETSEYLANYMVPAAKNNTLMFTETYNANMQAGNHPYLSSKYDVKAGEFKKENNSYNFSKKGNLELKRVIFLVTDNTASASELLINNLKPVLPQGVKLVGQTTYGKPVGFFGLDVGDYDMYLAEFESRNAEGKADFYQGMIPGGNFEGALVDDDVTHDFGDRNETMLKVALNYIDKGNYTVVGFRTQSINGADKAALDRANQKLDVNPEFKGAIHTRNIKQLNH